MSDLFVQVSALGSGTTTASVTLTGVTAGNTLIAFFGNGSNAAPTAFSVADGQGSYTALGSRISDNPDAVAMRAFALPNANAGSHTITGTTDSGNGCDIIVVEIGSTAGVSSVSGANQAAQAGPGTGSNAVSSGSVTVSAACTLVGFSMDSASTNTADEPAIGTGFTTRANGQSVNCGVYRMETIAASSNQAATFTAITGSNTFLTFGVAILNAGAAAPDQIYPECGDSLDAAALGETEHHDTGPWDWYQDNTCPNRVGVEPPIPERLPDAFEWIDPNETEEALWQWPWAHAPPPADVDTYVYSQTIHDSSAQLEDVDEDFAFADAPLTVSVAPDQIQSDDASTQLEDVDEDFGFADAPRPADVVAAELIQPQEPDPQPDEAEDFAFADAPLPDDILDQLFNEFGHFDDPADEYADPGHFDAPLDVPAAPADQIAPELGQDIEPTDEPDGFTDAPLQEDDQGAQHVEQPVDEEEIEGFADGPLPEDAPQLSIESAEQPESDEELEGFADAPLADEHDLGAQHLEQPTDDDGGGEGFTDAPFEAPPDLSFIPPECADNQIDTPDDEAFDFSIGPTPGDVAPVAVFPPPSQVLAGTVYGPNGNDYTGTLTAGGSAYLRRR